MLVQVQNRPPFADVMELVDMRDLGSRAAMRAGSSPFICTTGSISTCSLFPFMSRIEDTTLFPWRKG